MTKVLSSCYGESILFQVDFLENVSLINQDKIQPAHWSNNQATLFTAHARINDISSESYVLVSDNLNHTKHSVFPYMNFLFTDLQKKN